MTDQLPTKPEDQTTAKTGDQTKGTGDQQTGGDRGDRGDRGFGNKRRRRRARRSKEDDIKSWAPITKLGRLVKGGNIKYLEEIFLHSLPIKEPEIIDFFLKDTLKDEVMKIMPVQKQTRAGQRTKFKAIIAIGDSNGHIGLGSKCSKEVAIAIRGAINMAKLSIVPVRRGYWGNKIGKPHTVPTKVSGKCGSVRVRIVPAPRGTGIVAAYVPTRLLTLAGIEDAYTKTKGNTKTLSNFARAVFNALSSTYGYLTPDLWPEFQLSQSPLEEFATLLSLSEEKKLES